MDVDGLTSPSAFALCHPLICFYSISLHACSGIRLYLLKGCGNIVVSECLSASAVVPFLVQTGNATNIMGISYASLGVLI